MKGKNKCRILKEIRQRIADENDIPYVTRECSYQGECRGSCPKCEAELRYLEQELEKRRRLGKSVAVAAVAASLSLSLAACVPGVGSGSGGGTEPAASTLPQPISGLGVDGKDPLLPTEEPELMGKIAVLPTEWELEGDVVYIPPETEEELTGEPVPYPGWPAGETEYPEETEPESEKR